MAEHVHIYGGKSYIPGCDGCKQRARERSNDPTRKAAKAAAAAKRYHTPEGRLANLRKSWKRNGINPDVAQEALEQHNGTCDMCGTTVSGGSGGWHVDHDHQSGSVRGILCHRHNVGLGYFSDSVEELEQAIRYLQAHRSVQ